MASASAIFVEVHNKRYVLAAEAPICKEPLLGEFGQFSLRPAAAQVLAGTYNYSPQQLCQGTGATIGKMPKKIHPHQSQGCILGITRPSRRQHISPTSMPPKQQWLYTSELQWTEGDGG
mmetsp:Transcript_9081/g.19015  ORF Transcript_9081/g.19015 Transcript_9081/m.19015 type:complete len:119 (-) Transcript_9081:2358-2714(-)